jgi:hypothetical protein
MGNNLPNAGAPLCVQCGRYKHLGHTLYVVASVGNLKPICSCLRNRQKRRHENILSKGYCQYLLDISPINTHGFTSFDKRLYVLWSGKPLNADLARFESLAPCQLLKIVGRETVQFGSLRKRNQLIFFRSFRQRLGLQSRSDVGSLTLPTPSTLPTPARVRKIRRGSVKGFKCY